MILLWGLLEDDTFRSVHAWLARRDAPVIFANHAAVARSRVQFADRPRPHYRFSSDGQTYPLETLSAAYLRPYDARDYGDAANARAAPAGVWRATLVHHLLNDWAEHSPATIVNRPSAEATNHSKLRQALAIQAAGFRVPESLVSNDREQIRAFHARHGRVVYKSMSSVRSIVKELDPGVLEAAGPLGPVLFQQRVSGHNVRVHVVRQATFACAIESEAVDYRYAPAGLSPVDLPPEIASRCAALTERLGLLLAGIDLMVTPAGEWYCLEANPNPAFSYFDRSDEKDIARAVAELLMS